MNIQVVKKFPTMALTNHKTPKPTHEFVTEKPAKPKDGHLLCLYTSLMAPKIIPLIQSSTKELQPEQVCKLDWHFGICNHPNDYDFNWLEELRSERSLAIQVTIEIPDEIELTEVYSDMMGLQPPNQTLEPKPDFLKVAVDVAAAVAPIKLWASVFESLGTEREKKKAADEAYRLAHRFQMYRFVDKKGQRGIEWLLAKDMVTEWGSLLRGSVYIAFYGTINKSEKEHEAGMGVVQPQAKITLCPRLGFLAHDHLCYIPEELPDELTCVLEVKLLDPVS